MLTAGWLRPGSGLHGLCSAGSLASGPCLGFTSAWTSGAAEGVGTLRQRAPCPWVEAGQAAWCAEVEFRTALVRGSSTLLGGSIAAEGDSTAEVGGSNTLVVGSMAGVRGSNTLVGGSNTLVGGSIAGMEGSNTLVAGSTASALDDTFWSGCALQGERHTSEQVRSLRDAPPRRTSCLVQNCPISTLAWCLH